MYEHVKRDDANEKKKRRMNLYVSKSRDKNVQ